MSRPSTWQQLRALFSDRWQIPAALVAVAAAGLALRQLVPGRPAVDISLALADIAALEQAGATTDAADAIANLLNMQPPLPDEQRAELHDRLADIVYGQECARHKPNLKNARLILANHDAALHLGTAPTATRLLRAAHVADWLGQRDRAAADYRQTLVLTPSADQRRVAEQGLVRLLDGSPKHAAERQGLLEELLDDDGVSVGYLWWALQQTLRDALDENDTVRARLLLAKHGGRLKTSDLKGYEEYLWAWVMLREGRPEEAEPLALWVEEWLDSGTGDDPSLRDFGYLPAMNRWLLGQIHLELHRPEDALAAFDEALALHPDGDLALAAKAGQVRALAALGRHDRALELVSQTLAELAETIAPPAGAQARLCRVVRELGEQLAADGQHADAIAYLTQAELLTLAEDLNGRIALLEQLGRSAQEAAQTATDAQRQRWYRGEAGRYLEEAAGFVRGDAEHYSSLLWSAAQEYDAAGRAAGVRRVLGRFLEGRLDDPRLPRAMLQYGQVHELDGEFATALEWYGRLNAEYPKLLEAQRGRLLAAGCLRALGRDDEAEAMLRGLLSDDNVEPQANEFRDALLELCDLLYQQGRFGEAIGRLEEFATLYPQDPERYRARFLLADSYRRSADSLRREPPADADPAEVARVSHTRLVQAADLFAALLPDLAAAERTEMVQVYERLALLYRADCLVEQGDPAALGAALDTYRQVAARYEHEPAALTAHVGMASIYLRWGQVTEAARALERARWLLPNIPDSAFAASLDGADRSHWERYLRALSESNLFRDAFAMSP
ncbi:MAG: tetratricopeptide repeat protein [Phycisphaerae bacterium]|jgi:tetratricopeptide (TPR) repeat protein